MTDEERNEAAAILGRALVSFLASLPDDRREQQLAELWEILLMELSDPELERFTKLTGWTPPSYMRSESKPPYNPPELPGGLPDDIPF